MNSDLLLRIGTKLILPFILLFAIYVQLHGEYGPGGGFQAGVIVAAVVILVAITFGLNSAKRVAPRGLVEWMVPLGVLIYAGTGNNQINAGIGTDFVGLSEGFNLLTLNSGLGSVTVIGFGADDRLSLAAGSVPSELTIDRIGNDTLISKGSDLLATLQGTSVTAPIFV